MCVHVLPVADPRSLSVGWGGSDGVADPSECRHCPLQQEAAGEADEVQRLSHQAHE